LASTLAIEFGAHIIFKQYALFTVGKLEARFAGVALSLIAGYVAVRRSWTGHAQIA
jgi:hypothetical protein